MRPSSKSTFTPDPVESFLNEIPIFQLEASNDQANFMNDPTHFRRRQFGREEVEMVCFYPNPNDDSKYKIALTGDAADATIEFFHLLLNHPGPAALLKSFEVYALTCIDRATGYPDAISIVRKTSSNVANKFNELWLSRYPRPEVCAHDKGGEFIGPEFQRLLFDAGITAAPSTSRNPQSNAIVERLHLSMGNSLRAQLQDNITPRTLEEAKSMMDMAMAHALYAVRTNVSEATGFSPGAIAFHRDMISNQPLAFDFDAINNQRQLRVDKDIQRINSKRYDYDYKVGQQVLKRIFDFTKLDPRWEGPYVINQVHVNGNVTIQLTPHVRERVNIRKIKPYKPPTNSVLTPSVGS